jgi:D-tyrosyl-tRNA(Tyr) deacylase
MGVAQEDTTEDVDWLVKKTVNMRIFSDDNDKMNLSINEVGGHILLISQFTLHAQTAKGNRPSFTQAAKTDHANSLYLYAQNQLNLIQGKFCATGKFGHDMQISCLLDGPVTIIMDSVQRI